MPSTPDDDALSWAGEEGDPTLARSPEPQRARPRRGADPDDAPVTGRVSAVGATAARRAAAADEPAERAALVDDEPAPEVSSEVVGLAFFGAVAVLEAIAWYFVVRDNPTSVGSAFQVGVATAIEGLTVLAPVLWFAAVVTAARASGLPRRMVLLAVGVVVLFPWPWLVLR